MKNIFILLTILSLFSCEKESSTPQPITKRIKLEYSYVVFTDISNGDPTFDVTFENTSKQTQIVQNVKSGWSYKWNETLTVDENNVPLENQTRWLYFSVKDKTGDNRSVMVRIQRGGRIVSENTSNGIFSTSTVSGYF